MLVSICIASVRGHTIPYFVNSILAQTHKDWELIIAVQGNEPTLLNYVEQAQQNDSRISVIHIDRFGKTHALNQTISAAKGEIIAFTDDDCTAAPNWLQTIVECFEQEPRVGIVAGDLVPPKASPFSISTCPTTYTNECIYDPQERNYVGPTDFYWSGGNFAARRAVTDLIGPFDEYLGPGTAFPVADDTDFALRAEALGVTMWTTPRSIVYHTYGRRTGFKNFFKHHKAYAMGSGGLIGKLKLWGHRLYDEWAEELKLSSAFTNLKSNPRRGLLGLYTTKYRKMAFEQYLSQFELDENQLSVPKTKSHILTTN
ncbi:MAG: glycosyltransferase [Caldilineaceae bacterium]|nr:glycosyltransferase [Caldilineaceae bacterium]